MGPGDTATLVWAVELTRAEPLAKLFYASLPISTLPTDTPADTYFEPRILGVLSAGPRECLVRMSRPSGTVFGDRPWAATVKFGVGDHAPSRRYADFSLAYAGMLESFGPSELRLACGHWFRPDLVERESGSGWTYCTDGLPEVDEPVQLAIPDVSRAIGRRVTTGPCPLFKYANPEDRDGDFGGSLTMEVYAWRPLPEPPPRPEER